MAGGDKQEIWIKIAGLKPISLLLQNRADEEVYRMAESWVNKTWGEYADKYKGNMSPEYVMAMVAFKFAWFYAESAKQNNAVNDFLKDFENKLDDLVVKE